MKLITLDGSILNEPNDEIYSAEKGDRVDLLLNGKPLTRCIYCNVTKGIAIIIKTDLNGKPIVVNGDLVHMMVTGEITVKPV